MKNKKGNPMSLSIQSKKFTRKEKVKEDFRFKNQKTEVQTRESRVYAPFSRKVYKGRKRQNVGLGVKLKS